MIDYITNSKYPGVLIHIRLGIEIEYNIYGEDTGERVIYFASLL